MKKLEKLKSLEDYKKEKLLIMDKKRKDIIENLEVKQTIKKDNKKIKIPVCCSEDFSLDFDRLIKKLNLLIA